MADWACSATSARVSDFSLKSHRFVTIEDFLLNPEEVIEQADLQKFAKITPHYPGVRAPLEESAQTALLDTLSPMLSKAFDAPPGRWQMQGWYSIVTCRPDALLPIQRLPHVDGTDPDQIAMMLYLHSTAHGGTAFFRHLSSGLEALTDETFPVYKRNLEADVARTGLPPAAYLTDGSPLFQRIHVVEDRFNSAVFYRGNILHSGVIDNSAPLPQSAREGRLTINAFLRPPDC